MVGGGGSGRWVGTSIHTMLRQIELNNKDILNLSIGNQMIIKLNIILETELIQDTMSMGWDLVCTTGMGD